MPTINSTGTNTPTGTDQPALFIHGIYNDILALFNSHRGLQQTVLEHEAKIMGLKSLTEGLQGLISEQVLRSETAEAQL